ncbi:MAG TPA: hypothetical protein DIW37_16705 [Chryseobacterium sp.]|nr:hypothetical protein [Chryseobacterium sp.]
MPVPSNIDELLELIADQIIDNNSGLIEEHTLRYVLNQLVTILDTKVSLISPNLTAEQLQIWKNIADFKASDSIGVITNSTVFPDAKCWGFAAPGSYTNANNTTITANSIGIITYDGINTFSNISIPIPQNSPNIRIYEDLTTGTVLNAKEQVISNNVPYIVLQSATVGTDLPTGSKFKALGGLEKYEYLLDVNKSYRVNAIPTTEVIQNILENSVTYGGKFLQYDNTMTTNVNYPALGVIYNLDVTNSYKLRVNQMFDIQAGNLPSIVGVKEDDTVYTILRYTDPGFTGLKEFDLTGVKSISIQVQQGHFPQIKLFNYEKVNLDAKNYADDRFKVLEHFINPYEIQWEEITMPQSGEVDNQVMTGSFIPVNSAGFAYGKIPIALLSGYDYIKVSGGINAGDALWLWGQNLQTAVYDKLLLGNKNGEFQFEIDHAKYESYGYTRNKTSTKFYKGKKVFISREKDSVYNFIKNNSAVSRHRGVDAFAEFGVGKDTNTPAQNTTALNSAIAAAQAANVPCYLPGGDIRHTGNIVYPQNVILEGAGMRLTRLISTTAAPALVSPTTAADPYFGLGLGSIREMTIDGDHIGTNGIEIKNVANSKYSNVLIKSFTNKCLIGYGLLIFEFDNVYFQDAKYGIYLDYSTDSGFGGMHSNLIVFNRCHFLDLTKIGAELTHGAMYTFNSCSIGGTGTDGDDATGFCKAYNLSPLNEGIDIQFNSCWSEQMRGGYWLNLSQANGVTTFNDTMVWNFGTCKKGIINTGSKVLLSGSSYVKGFVTVGVETTNGGHTKTQGFATVDTHTESSGGVFN